MRFKNLRIDDGEQQHNRDDGNTHCLLSRRRVRDRRTHVIKNDDDFGLGVQQNGASWSVSRRDSLQNVFVWPWLGVAGCLLSGRLHFISKPTGNCQECNECSPDLDESFQFESSRVNRPIAVYAAMVKAGVCLNAVRQKMTVDRLPEAEIDAFVRHFVPPSPIFTAASSSSSASKAEKSSVSTKYVPPKSLSELMAAPKGNHSYSPNEAFCLQVFWPAPSLAAAHTLLEGLSKVFTSSIVCFYWLV